jgi:uncharacterized protein YndB with AHSA1/START domain
MKTLEFKISIAAPKEKVWDTMLHPDTYKQWTAVSWPDSFYKGKWEKGEKISFISDDGSGTMALIKELKPYEHIVATHIAILNVGGIEDTTTEPAKRWIGNTEEYTFKERNGETDLTLKITTNPDFEKMFNDGWPNALKKLKEICENK